MTNTNTTKTLALAVLVALAAGCDREKGDAVADPDTVPEAPAVAAPPVADVNPAGATDDFLVFGRWDSTSDGNIDANEFNAGLNQGTWFRDWDADGNGELSDAEFRTATAGWRTAPEGVEQDGLFDVWDSDKDGVVDTVEFNTGVYSTWDRDSNDMIDNSEYDTGVNWFGWR